MTKLNVLLMVLLVGTSIPAWAKHKSKEKIEPPEFRRLMEGTRQQLQPKLLDKPFALYDKNLLSETKTAGADESLAYPSLGLKPFAGQRGLASIPWAETGAGATLLQVK